MNATKRIVIKSEPLHVVPQATLKQIADLVVDHVSDIAAFANGDLSRSDLEAGFQALVLAIYERQPVCPECGGNGQFIKQDARCLWRCPRCGGRGIDWTAQS